MSSCGSTEPCNSKICHTAPNNLYTQENAHQAIKTQSAHDHRLKVRKCNSCLSHLTLSVVILCVLASVTLASASKANPDFDNLLNNLSDTGLTHQQRWL